MSDYISRSDVTDCIECLSEGLTWLDVRVDSAMDAVNAIPAADVRPVVRGKWQKCLIAADRQYDTKGMSQIIEGYICDACDNFSVSMYRYCPNCGAWMEES